MNGTIAGLVAITAGCHIMTVPGAMLVGAIGGLISVGFMRLLILARIDDAIGAIPSHLAAGVWGTLAVALLAPNGSWGTGLSRWEQLLVQLEGTLAIGAYSFVFSYALLKLIDRWLPLRVGQREERIGLNITEHGAGSALLDLIEQMDAQAKRGDFSKPVNVEPETEAGRIALFYNAVLEKVKLSSDRREMALRKLHQQASYDTLTGLTNRRFFLEAVKRSLGRISRNGSCGALLYLDLDGFKAINDEHGHEYGDQVLREVAVRVTGCIRETDLAGRLGGDEFAVLLEDCNKLKDATKAADKIIAAVSEPYRVDDVEMGIGVSIGIAPLGGGKAVTHKQLIHDADQAMYRAKAQGKGRYCVADVPQLQLSVCGELG